MVLGQPLSTFSSLVLSVFFSEFFLRNFVVRIVATFIQFLLLSNYEGYFLVLWFVLRQLNYRLKEVNIAVDVGWGGGL